MRGPLLISLLASGCYLSHELDRACERGPLGAHPAPMAGYGPERARRSSQPLPTSPVELWATNVGDVVGDPVVASDGTFFVVVDTNTDDTALLGDTLVALGPDGRVRWTHAEGPAIGAPFLTCEGHVHVHVRHRWPGLELVTLDASGTERGRVSLPDQTWADPIVHDGALVYRAVDFDARWGAVRAIARDGTLLWEVALPSTHVPPHASSGDVVYAASATPEMGDGELTAIDAADGTVAWRTSLGAPPASGPAVGDDGAVRIVVGTEVGSLVVFEPDGRLRARTNLGGSATAHPIGLSSDGTAFVRTHDRLLAIDAAGAVAWERSTPGGLAFDLTIARGGLLLSHAGFSAIDPADGRTLWTAGEALRPSDRPGLLSAASTAIVAGGGRFYAWWHDGTLAAFGDR